MTLGEKNGHSRCLFCGHLNPRSLNLCFTSDGDDGVSTHWKAGSDLQGYDDILHGGVIAGLLDPAMTHCLFHRGVQAVTGELQVRFLQPVPCKAVLELRAWLVVARPPLYRVAAEVLQEQNVMARAEAKFMQCPMRQHRIADLK